MLTLIKREIQDHKIYFLIAFLMSIVFSLSIIAGAYRPEQKDVIPILFTFLAIITIIGVCTLGASQTHTEKTRKISQFLLTLPVTRRQIFAARVLTGISAILVLLVPPAVTTNIVGLGFAGLWQGEASYKYLIIEIFSSLFLACLGLYCTGLLCGLSKSRLAATPTLLGLILSIFLLSLIVIKGFGIEASIIMFFYVASCLTFSWLKFNSAAFI